MNFGEPPISMTKSDLMKSSKDGLIRLAKWEGLRYNLELMSKRQLVKLIRWKITRNKNRMFG